LRISWFIVGIVTTSSNTPIAKHDNRPGRWRRRVDEFPYL